MMQDTFGQIDWFRRKLGEVPLLLLHIRAQALPSMQGAAEPRVSGTKERTTAPLRIDPIDDADELWAVVCALAVMYAERTQTAPPAVLRRQWIVQGSVRRVHGFASQDQERIYLDAVTVTRFLLDHAFTLVTDREYSVPLDELVDWMDSMRRRYPDAPKFQGARHRCPKCGQSAVAPVYSERGELLELRCGYIDADGSRHGCGAKRVM